MWFVFSVWCVCVIVCGRQYELLDNIGYTEDVHHSMFRELPDNIEDAILVSLKNCSDVSWPNPSPVLAVQHSMNTLTQMLRPSPERKPAEVWWYCF